MKTEKCKWFGLILFLYDYSYILHYNNLSFFITTNNSQNLQIRIWHGTFFSCITQDTFFSCIIKKF